MTIQEQTSILLFNGSSTHIALTSAEALSITEHSFTVEAWIRVDDFAGLADKPILGSDTFEQNEGLHLIIRNGYPYLGFFQNDIKGRTKLEANVWYHIAWRYNHQKQEQAILINGVLDSINGGHPPYSGSNDLMIGRWASNRYFQGAIADLRIWDFARGPAQIRADMHKRLTGSENGLAAYWRLDDNNNEMVADSTVHHAHGIVQGDPIWVDISPPFARENQYVLTFDGQLDHMFISPYDQFPDKALTFECWLRSGNASKAGTIVSYANSQSNDAFTVYNHGNVTLIINGQSISTGVAFNDGEWHHLAVSWRSSDGRLLLYKDGEIVSEKAIAAGAVIANNGAFVLGQEQDLILGGFDPNQAFKGELAEVRFWRKVRTSNQIKTSLGSKLSGTEDGLISCWSLDQSPASINATNQLTAAPDGAFNGPTWVNPSGPLLSVPGNLLSLDGNDNYIELPQDVWFGETFSIEGWVYIHKHMTWSRLLDFGNGPAANNVLLTLSERDTGRMGLHLFKGNKNILALASAAPLPLKQWVHVAATVTASEARLYVDGAEVAFNTYPGPVSAIERSSNYIGRSNWVIDQFANAIFQEIRIWDRVLPPAEIQARRFTPVSGEIPGLTAHWALAEGKGKIAKNSVNAELNGQIQTANWISPPLPVPTTDKNVLEFDGIDDCLTIMIDVPETEFTHELWFRTANPNGGLFTVRAQAIVGIGSQDRHIYLKGGNIFARVWNNEVIQSTNLNLADQQWHHVAHVVGASENGQKLYIDGKLVASGNKAQSDFFWDSHVLIGYSDDSSPQKFFQGQIYEVRMWDKARTQVEIQSKLNRLGVAQEPNLIGCWHLSEVTHQVPNIGPGTHPALLSGPQWVPASLPLPQRDSQKVLMVNGKADKVMLAQDFEWPVGSAVTVEFWVKINEKDIRNGSLFTIGDQNNPHRFQAHVTWGNKALYWDYGNLRGTGRIVVNLTSHLGQWIHVALVSAGNAGNFKAIYINGVLFRSAKVSDGPKVHLSGLWLGRYLQNYQVGQIAEFRIWRKVRTGAEILADMTRPLVGNEPGLAGYWPLNNQLADGITPRPPGKVIDATWAKVDMPLQTVAETQPLLAPTFNGHSSYINIPNAPHLTITEQLTIEAWVKPQGAGRDIIFYTVTDHHGLASGWSLRCGNSQAQFMVTINQNHISVTTNNELPLNQWYHLAGVYDGHSLHLYVNGVLKGSTVATGALTPYQGNLNIGRNSRWTDRVFQGQILEVRVWRKALSANEIQKNLFFHLKGNEIGLAGYWQLNDGRTATTIKDSSPYKNHGTIAHVEWQEIADQVYALTNLGTAPIDLATELANTVAERAILQEKLNNVTSLLASTKQDQSALQIQFNQLQISMNQQRDELLAAFVNERGTFNATIADLQAQITEGLAEEGKINLSTLIENTNAEITTARNKLQSDSGNYSLDQVNIELKVIPDTDGTSLTFPDAEQLAQVNQLSSINLEFSAAEDPVPPPKQVQVPDLSGYTELMAQRKVSELGLILEINYQAIKPVAGEPSKEERVVGQFPSKGQMVDANSTITVYIGKLIS